MKIIFYPLLTMTWAALIWAASCSGSREPVYMDSSVPVYIRVKDLMKRMTLEEKVAQMCQYVGPDHMRESKKRIRNDEIIYNDAWGVYPGMSPEEVEEMTASGMTGSFLHVVTPSETNRLQALARKSRLKIPLLVGIDAIHGNGLVRGSTIYPSPITLSSTWDDALVREVSRQTALEMRAMGAHWTFTPNIDIARDARWGRFGETSGEDPYLVGRMGVAQVEGFQQGDYTGYDKVIACAKHMIAGGDPINGCNKSATDISLRTLYEVHLPPYEKTVKEAGVYTVMMAHNEINGIPCHNNPWLTDILRRDYGLPGFVASDWMDIERLEIHRVVPSLDEAFVQSVESGIDMHMHGPEYFESVVGAVKSGRIKERRIDEACAPILEAKFRLGLFENPFVDEEAFPGKIYTPGHVATALEAARKGIILLKNESVLPISGRRVFLTGLNADNQSMLGDWVYSQPDQNVVTFRRGLEEACRKHNTAFTYFNCGEMVSRFDIPDRSTQAAAAARGSDLAVIVVGENNVRYLPNSTCSENVDRAELSLLNNQLDLVKKIKAAGVPVVVVFVTGRPLGEEWIAENADAVIWAWEPGCMGGRALAEILFGEVNPSGKLTATIPRHVGQVKTFYNHKSMHNFHPPIDIKKGPLYEFGQGMSYTTYEYSNLLLSAEKISPKGSVKVYVDVSNTGDMDGEEIVQLYIRDDVSLVTRPVKELKGFERLALKAGETKTVSFEIDTRMLAYYDPDMNLIAEKGMFTVMAGPSSRDADLMTIPVEMTGTEHFR